jgi:hypothetical protein
MIPQTNMNAITNIKIIGDSWWRGIFALCQQTKKNVHTTPFSALTWQKWRYSLTSELFLKGVFLHICEVFVHASLVWPGTLLTHETKNFSWEVLLLMMRSLSILLMYEYYIIFFKLTCSNDGEPHTILILLWRWLRLTVSRCDQFKLFAWVKCLRSTKPPCVQYFNGVSCHSFHDGDNFQWPSSVSH